MAGAADAVPGEMEMNFPSADRTIYLRTWGNPYTKPPPGFPRLLWWGQADKENSDQDELLFIAVQKAPRNVPEKLKCRYSFVTALPLKKTNLRAPEEVLKMRLAALRKKVEKKAPKWAPEWAEEEIARQIRENPHKYTLDACRKMQKEKAAMEDSLREARCAGLPPERRIWVEDGFVLYGGLREIPRIDVPSDSLKWVYMSIGMKTFPEHRKPKKELGFEEAWGIVSD